MKKIIKSQFYQFFLELIPCVSFICIVALSIWLAIAENSFGEPITGDVYYADFLIQGTMLPLFFIAIAIPILCGGDFLDKTSNYELMSGHLRWESYFGRVIPCIVIGVLGWLIISVAPIIVLTIMNGWGGKIAVSAVIGRYALTLLPLIRFICEIIFLTFVIKNPYIIMALSYVMIMVMSIMAPKGNPFLTGLSNVLHFSWIDSWVTYGLGSLDGSTNYIYEASIPPSDIINTVVFSVIISAAVLYLGYVFFKKDDME